MPKSNLQPKENIHGVKKPVIMGILNITPDSFSDGGKYFKLEDAIKHAEELIHSGADIIDIGGESTRPGAIPVSQEEELKRVIPVISVIARSVSNKAISKRKGIASPSARNDKPVLISIDTYKSKVAEEAINAGADIINDVSGLTKDPDMVKVAARRGCKLVIMHNNGIPATKPEARGKKQEARNNHASCLMPPASIIEEVYKWLEKQTNFAKANGVKRENIIIDPGIGFSKTAEEDLFLIENLKALKSLDFPILVGHSKKSFIKKLFGNCDIEKKSQELIQLAIKNGADILRIHQIA